MKTLIIEEIQLKTLTRKFIPEFQTSQKGAETVIRIINIDSLKYYCMYIQCIVKLYFTRIANHTQRAIQTNVENICHNICLKNCNKIYDKNYSKIYFRN